MKAKASALSSLFLMALLLLTARSNLFGQAADCYDYQCPSKILAPCEGVWGARVWYTVYATNRCDPTQPPTVTYSVPPGSVFPPGTNVVCATIQIPGLPPRNCCWEVIVDGCCSSNCIEVLCPRDMIVPCTQTPQGFGAFVPLPQPTATNHCGDHIVPSTLQWRCFPQTPANQPAFFPPGTNHVVWCLVDANGNYVDCCCFEVIVTGCPQTTDQCRPQIICPTDISMQCTAAGGGAIVFFPPPKIIDPCGLVIATNCTYTSGTFFPNGKTTVTCCITWRNPATGALITECCCFDVIVRCCQTNCVSRLDCPTNIVVDCPGPNGTPLNYTVFGTNTCEPTHVVCDPPPGSIVFGPTNVCCRLVNSSGVVLAQCCFKVLVNDTVPPTIDCPPDIFAVSSNCQPVAVPLPIIPAHDNCDPNPVVHCDPNTNVFPCGVTTVTCWATDYNGNSNKCSFNVTVFCDNRTEITCPPDITVKCAAPTGAVVTYTITATNRCTNIVSTGCNPPSGSVFLPGTTNVCCFAVDGFGDTVRCCFKVTVIPDDIPPVITCPSNIVVTSVNCTPIDVQYPAPIATDNCQLDYIRCNPLSGSSFPVGTTTVTCCAFDKAGNSACCTFTVTVRCPSNDCVRVICPTNIVVDCASTNGATVTFNAYGTNICQGGFVPVVCTPPSGSVFPPGVTHVCCTNTTSPSSAVSFCCFDVTVRADTVPPTITCPTNIVVTSPNCTSIDVQYPPPTASDDCQLDHVICNPPSGSPFPVGTTTVTCCAYDKAGNSACCTFTVTVRCPDCVRVVCPTNIVVDCTGPNGAVVNFNAYGTNICTGQPVPITCNAPSGNFFPPGITTVCCTNVTAGVVSYCCFTVTVRPDTVPPTITCPSNIVVISPNCTPMDVQYPPPTATDNCQLDHVDCNPPSGSPFPVGTTTVTCCAFDKAGNSACCTFTVTVRCQDCVRVVCPTNIVVDCAGPNGAVVTYNAYATNTCTGGSAPLNCSRPSGSVFPIGVTTVCCTNTAGTTVQWCCFDVTVRPDTEPPVINCPSNIYILCAKPNGQKVDYIVGARDDCDPAPIVTCIPPSGSHFAIGCTNVTCVATDHAGNSSTCTFRVCLLAQGCYLFNPSFEVVLPNLPAPNFCGDPINFALGWSALSGTPDLFRPPFASLAPGNCRGKERPCEGTNYAGLEGGYTTSGGFVTEEMMGTLVAPLSNGKQFRLIACLSLAESSPGPVLVEFVLANSGNLAQQQVIHQVWVQQMNGWMNYQPACFTVPQLGNWDRLIIRMAKVVPGTHTYQVGYVYVDNVNICCCKPVIHPPVLTDTTVTVAWEGRGQLQATDVLSDMIDWRNVDTPVEYDPETDTFRTTMPRSDAMNLFFRIVGSDGGVGCSECAGGGGGAGGS